MKRIALLLWLLPCAIWAEGELSASSALTLIQRDGPAKTLGSLWGTPGWDQLTAGVASGDAKWLEVAKQIFVATDAGSTSELYDAVAWALPKAPVEVLKLVEHSRADWGVVCSGPPVDYPSEGPEVYFKAALTAVKSVRAKSLKGTREFCLGQLEASRRAAGA
jgi:hypothetical protein